MVLARRIKSITGEKCDKSHQSSFKKGVISKFITSSIDLQRYFSFDFLGLNIMFCQPPEHLQDINNIIYCICGPILIESSYATNLRGCPKLECSKTSFFCDFF